MKSSRKRRGEGKESAESSRERANFSAKRAQEIASQTSRPAPQERPASRRASLETVGIGLRWLLSTLVVLALAAALVFYALQHPALKKGFSYGEPVPVPAGEVTLACPQVPPTVNPAAVDGAGNPLPPPQIAGSVTATVLARTGKVPVDAVYAPLGSTGKKTAPTQSPEAAASPEVAASPEAATTPSPSEDPNADVELRPKSAMLQAELPKPVSGFLRAAPWEKQVALAAADIEQSVSSGDYRGLATATCQTAGLDSWLVGGSTTPGNSTVLQLMNPSANSVDAKVEIWGDTGKLEFPRGEKITVSPKDQVSIPLESQVPDVQSLVVHVTSSGAGVAASLMTHSLQGLTAGGVSLVHVSAPMAQTQVIPGVAMNADLGAVRILNPGEEPTRASIEVVNENGRFPLPGGTEVTLDPQAVFDFTLGGLQAGNYAVIVKANAPIVAGAVVYRHGGESATDQGKFVRDHAWLPALEPGGGVVLGPAAIERQLLVTNLTEETKEFKVGGETHVVNAGTTIVLPLTAEVARLVEAPELYVTQVLTTNLGDGLGIDALEPAPDLAASRQVYVHLGN